MKKESIITTITFTVLIAAFAMGIYFIVRLVNGPGSFEDGPRSGIMSGELKTYTHPDYGFTFNYPAGFKLGRFPEGDGEVILVQSEDGKQGFQIFISLYEEEKPLSKAIIQESAPDMKISNDKEIEIGAKLREQEDRSLAPAEENIQALSFDSTGSGGGDTHEIWFVQDGNLYQVTSFTDFGGQMEKILETLRFN